MNDASHKQQNQIGERLRRAREYVGLSQKQVAAALELPLLTVTQIERGACTVEEVQLGKLAKLYLRTVDYLLSGVEPIADGPVQRAFLASAVKSHSEADLEK